jgi:hypothetical protein
MQNSGIDTSAVKPTKQEKLVAAAVSDEVEDWSSDWTYETCSSSDEEAVDYVKNPDGSYTYSLPR